MVAGFVVRRRLPFKRRDAKKEKLYWEHNAGKALLQSSVNDADLVTDWDYFYQTARDDADVVPPWLHTLQLACCICGTLSWIVIASDGRVMDWLRRALMWIVVGVLNVLSFLFFSLPIMLFSSLRRNGIGDYHVVRGIESRLEDCDYWFYTAIVRVRSSFETGFGFPSGAVLFLGIVMEDLPQIAVTFLIEDVIKSDEAMGEIRNASGAAQINLVFAVFDICHKLAEAYDLRHDVVKTGDAALLTLRGHSKRVTALAAVDGTRFVSGSYGGKWQLWDAVRGKAVGSLIGHASKNAEVTDMAMLDETRVIVTYRIVAYNRDQTMVFDVETGSILKSLYRVAGHAMAVAVSPSGESFLTACTDGVVQHWKSSDLELIKEFDGIMPRHSFCSMSLAFLDNNLFVTTMSDSHWIWISALDLKRFSLQTSSKVQCVIATSSSSLLAGLSNGNIERWDINSRSMIKPFEGHRDSVVSLAKIDDTLFASGSSDKTAMVWSIQTGLCLRTLSGHTASVQAVAYLPTAGRSIVTGSGDKSIKIWKLDAEVFGGADGNVEDESDGEDA